MNLTECREKIDRIDEEIVRLFEERMAVAEEVAAYKIAAGRNVLDPEREEQKLERVRSLTHSEFNARGAAELFRQLMSMSRKKQYTLMREKGITGRTPFIPVDSLDTAGARIAFQGINGAYSEAAMLKYFGEGAEGRPAKTFRDAMRLLEEGSADYAVLPLENSSAGVVGANYDLLTEFDNYIVAEQVIVIDNCLLGLPEAEISDIRAVYSHPQALMQCGRYLDSHASWKQVSYANTAMAAKKIRDDGDISTAAIAGRRAAEVYGLKILAPDISFSEGNSTRFIIVTNQKIYRKDAGKISICFELPHKSGSLYQSLSHFIYNDLNMTKIESRPVQDRPWEYRFFVDFEGNFADVSVRNALQGIREETLNLRVLGNY